MAVVRTTAGGIGREGGGGAGVDEEAMGAGGGGAVSLSVCSRALAAA